MWQLRFNGVIFPIQTPRVTMPFRATETKWYSDENPHRGVDIAPYPGSLGAFVRMPVHGQVMYVGDHTYAGKEIVTRHFVPYAFGATGLDGVVYENPPLAPFHIRTTHHRRIDVSKGSEVPSGELIALVGQTGLYCNGPHVHMELHLDGVYPGRVVDPLDFFIAAIPGLRDTLIRPW